MEEGKTDFMAINRLMTSLGSQRNQLIKAENIEEMDRLCEEIHNTEKQIFQERQKTLKGLQTRKDEILQQIVTLEASIDDINRDINIQTARFRDGMMARLMRLETDINERRAELSLPTM